MKKLAILGLVVMGSAAWAVSSNADQNACFGQARAGDASTGAAGHPIGRIHFSMRKGANAELNQSFRDACNG